jgi:hypothetical protein
MKQIVLGILAAFFLIAAPAMAQAPKTVRSTTQTAPARPSLDALVTRIDGYWKLLTERKKARAGEYVIDADRDNFFSSTIPTFTNPQLKSLELSADRREATATVLVKREMQPFKRMMDWPVVERWRFERGSWYRNFPKMTKLPLPETGNPLELSAEESEPVKAQIRKDFKIEKTVLDFGTVRDTAPLQLSLKYTLSGKDPVLLRFKTPLGFGIQGGDELEAKPGEQELRLIVPAWQLEGPVHERITITARRQGVDVPFEIEVRGNVYVPVAFSPKILKFSRGENEKQVRIRNNSKSDIELLPISSETGEIIVEPIPAKVPAGQEVMLKVKLDKGTENLKANKLDSLVIPLSNPVDDVNSISISVTMNAVDTGRAANAPSVPKSIADIIGAASGKQEAPDLTIQSDKSQTCQSAPDSK